MTEMWVWGLAGLIIGAIWGGLAANYLAQREIDHWRALVIERKVAYDKMVTFYMGLIQLQRDQIEEIEAGQLHNRLIGLVDKARVMCRH